MVDGVLTLTSYWQSSTTTADYNKQEMSTPITTRHGNWQDSDVHAVNEYIAAWFQIQTLSVFDTC